MCVNVCAWYTMMDWHLIQGVFLPETKCSWDRLHIHYELYQNNAGTKNEWMKKDNHICFLRTLTWGESRRVGTLGGGQGIAAAACWGFGWAMRSVTPCAWALWRGAGGAWRGGGTGSWHHTSWVLWSVSAHSTEDTFPIHPWEGTN